MDSGLEKVTRGKVTRGFYRRDAESLAQKTTNAGDRVGSSVTQTAKGLYGQGNAGRLSCELQISFPQQPEERGPDLQLYPGPVIVLINESKSQQSTAAPLEVS